MIKFAWDKDVMPLYVFIISLVVIVAIYALYFLIFGKVVKRKAPFIFLAVSFLLAIGTFLFNALYGFIVVMAFTIAIVSICLFGNLGDFRRFIASPFSKKHAKPQNFGVEKIFDSAAMYKQIESAVLSLSKSRTGAIITFEKNTSLKEIMNNGVPVKAPVSAELLLTIFYPGTRLHDGAVVIKGNEIVAASVFYTPTTKAFGGKYGSRHRAALGISEISDAVTVVVSEETGRISIAIDGQLETIDPSNFLRAFENFMSIEGE